MSKRFGNLVLQLAGSSPVAEILQREFAILPDAGDRSPDLAYYFSAEPQPIPDGAVTVGNVSYTKDSFVVRSSMFHYTVAAPRAGSQSMSVQIYTPQLNSGRGASPVLRAILPDVVRETLDRYARFSYTTTEEEHAHAFLFQVFGYLTQMELLSKRATFLHALSVEHSGRAVAFTGWGGVGKTTLAADLVGRRGWNFLADDLSIVDSSGVVYCNPLHIWVYPYHVLQDPEVWKTLVPVRGPVDRLQWLWNEWRRGEDGVRRRWSPSQLFGPNRIALQSQLAAVVLLIRGDVDRPVLMTSDPVAMARMASNMILYELGSFPELSAATNAGPVPSPLPSFSRVQRQMREVLTEAFTDVNCYICTLPLDGDGFNMRDLFDFIDLGSLLGH